MDEDQQLLDALKQYDAANLPFNDARMKLLEQGYEEYEIIAAASDISYGIKKNTSLEANKSPLPPTLQLASISSERVLLEDLKKRRRQAFGYDSNGLVGLFNSHVGHGSIDMLGVPVGTLIVVGVIITAVLYIFSFITPVLPNYTIKVFLILYLLFVGAWFTFRVIELNKKIERLESSQGKSSRLSVEAIISYVILGTLIWTVIGLF